MIRSTEPRRPRMIRHRTERVPEQDEAVTQDDPRDAEYPDAVKAAKVALVPLTVEDLGAVLEDGETYHQLGAEPCGRETSRMVWKGDKQNPVEGR